METRNNPTLLSHLKTLPDYERAKKTTLGYIGRSRHIRNYLSKHKTDIFCPELYDETWSAEKNMAYMLGGIEAQRPFLIVSTLHDIAKRASEAADRHQPLLGYTVAEILILQDNGYTFAPYLDNPSLCIATPPTEKVQNPIIKAYGHTKSATVSTEIARIFTLKLEMEFAKLITDSNTNKAEQRSSSSRRTHRTRYGTLFQQTPRQSLQKHRDLKKKVKGYNNREADITEIEDKRAECATRFGKG